MPRPADRQSCYEYVVDCTLDAVLDLEELEGNTCTVTFSDIANGSFPGDNCPDQLWFEVRNVFDLNQPDDDITVMALATDSVSGAACTGSSIPLRVIETQVEFIGGPVVRTFDYAVSGTEVCSVAPGCDPITNPFCNPDPDCTGGVTTCRYLESLRQVTEADVTQFGITNLIYRVVIPESSSSPPPVAISVSSRCPGPD